MPQSYTQVYVHYIFSTKDREPLIQTEWAARMYSYFGGIARNEDCTLLAANGMADHSHLLIRLRGETSVSELIRDLKANVSKWIHEEFCEARRFGWQAGFGAFSVSHSNVPDVIRYIENQERHHRKMTFQEEFVKFLKRHGVEYDEKYIWG